jgi:crotonobetainyl-CoA hydratase
LSAAVGAALTEVDADDELHVAILVGAGRAFCAGADLKAVSAGESVTAPGHDDWGFAGLIGHTVSKPLIAAVNGLAFGGGPEIVLACDLAVMSADAKLALPEVKRGLIATGGGLIGLPRQLPVKLALEMALTGEPIDAPTALRWGLVNRVVPADEVLPAALSLAGTIAANAPLSVQATKRVVKQALGAVADWDRGVWAVQNNEIAALLRSRDAAEGTAASAEKRLPNWSGT